MTLSNAAAPKSASGKNALVDVSKGASLIASALLRRQLTPDGQDRVAVNDRPSVRSEKLTVNRWSEGLKKTCMLIASPGCTAMLGKRGPSGNICQNGASTGVVLFSQPATSPTCSRVDDVARKPSSPTQCAENAPLGLVTPRQSSWGT